MLGAKNKIYLQVLISLFLFSGLVSSIRAQTTSAEEIALQFDVPLLVRQDIIVLYDGRSVYLPLVELFTLLETEVTSNVSQLRFSGMAPSTNDHFEIDLNRGTADIGDKRLALNRSDYLMGAIDLYLRVDQFERFFGLPIKFDFSKLMIHMPLDKKLPAYQRLLRKKARNKLKENEKISTSFVTLAQKREKFKGGVADWVISTNPISTGGSGTQYFSTNLGAVALGGDLTLSGNANTNTGVDLKQFNYRWHYSFNDNKYINQAELGKIFTGGSLSRGLTGFKITNKPAVRRRIFKSTVITGYVGANYEVELYVNGALVDFQYSDRNGEYRFDLDIEYGSTRVMLKMFGPNGEIRTEEKDISTPFNLIPKGETEYVFTAGRAETNNDESRNYSQASFYYGASENFTVGLLSDIPVSSPDNEPTTYDLEATYLLKDRMILGGSYSPGNRVQAGVSISRLSSVSLNGGYTRYFENDYRNTIKRQSTIDLTISAPVRLGRRNIGLRLGIMLDNFPRYRMMNANYGINGSFYRFYLNYIGSYRVTDYGSSKNKSMSSRLLFSTNLIKFAYPQIRIDYDHVSKQVSSYAVYVARQLFSRGQITISYEHSPIWNSNTASFKLLIFTDFAHFASRLSTSGKFTSLNQTQRGSVRFDQATKRFNFDRRNGVGFGSALLRPYLDYNYNGVFDGADQYYPGVKARIKGGRAKPSKNDGDTYYYYDGLIAYNEYTIQVDEYSIDNPTLIPAAENYKVTIVPNMVTPIDVPLIKAAEVTGRIERVIGQNLAGVGGIKVHLLNITRDLETQVTTFNAGEYFHLGLLPGKHRAYLDPNQLASYGYTSKPLSIEFEVNPVEGGAIVENINFMLIPIESKK